MNQARKLLSSLSLRQQVSIGLALLAVGAGLWLFTKWNHERDFQPLYANLAAEDAGAVIAKLKEEGIEYRVDDSGNVLRAPAERVAELRLRMAAAGLPKSGRIGFELFDKNSFGLTEFAEQVNYRRAIEGELERSIRALSEIERARVHISLPKDSVFLESKQEAKASVVVTLRAGARLSAQNGAAISYLVASAVDRLAPEAVSVIDSRGNLLVRPRRVSEAGADQPEVDFDYRQKIERDLALKVSSTLEPLLGADKYRVGASVEIDFTSGDQSEETFDPSKSVMVSEQKTEDSSGTPLQAGAPGTAANLPRPPTRAAGSTTSATRKTESVSYQTSRVVKRTKIPQGAVKRMSLAVLVDHNVRWEGAGAKAKRILEPPSPERLKSIRDLVAATVGFSESRGDQLTVEALPFESSIHSEPPSGLGAPDSAPPDGNLPLWLRKYLQDMPKGLRIGIGAGLALIIAAPILLIAMRRRKPQLAAPSTGGAIHASADPQAAFEGQMAFRAATQERLDAEAMLALKAPPPGTKKGEILSKHLKNAVKADPGLSAQLLRTWMDESEAIR